MTKNGLRVLVCGNYGRPSEEVNGQSIKTWTMRDALASRLGTDAVDMLDTSAAFRNPLSFYLTARKRFARSTHVVMLPGPRALPVLLEVFLWWRRRAHKDLRYVVIGGWLPELLQEKPRLRNLCSRLDGIYVETQAMEQSIRAQGLTNVQWLPNFRSFDRGMSRRPKAHQLPLRLVFCARLFKEKGIEDAIEAVALLNASSPEPVVLLDVYGPIEPQYEEQFRAVMARAGHVSYNGILSPAEIYSTLQQYNLLLFPTYYSDEGFPGTIVDSFIAGVPVLASDWRYNRELVQEGVTGELCAPRSPRDLADQIGRFVAAPQRLADMTRHCIEQAEKYHVDHVLEEFTREVEAASATDPVHRF